MEQSAYKERGMRSFLAVYTTRLVAYYQSKEGQLQTESVTIIGQTINA
jgi:hypothetical protein